MNLLAWMILVGAAVLEVGGDAAVRKGLRGSGVLWVLAGCLLLGSYGMLVNTLRWDFSKLLGIYVAVFGCTSVLLGAFIFHESIPPSTWIGLTLIVAGGLIIQSGVR